MHFSIFMERFFYRCNCEKTSLKRRQALSSLSLRNYIAIISELITSKFS